MKICTKCKESKPESEFGPVRNSKDGLNWRCRPCVREYSRYHYKSGRDAVAKAQRKAEFNRKRALGIKPCAKCKEWKPEKEFNIDTSHANGLSSRCSACVAQGKRDSYRELTPEQRLRMRRRYHESDKLLVRLTSHGLTLELYEAILRVQGGVCAVCGRVPPGGKFVIDHDKSCCPGEKSCGKCVRGLTCANHNSGMGMLEDSPILLRRAVDYLENPPAASILRP